MTARLVEDLRHLRAAARLALRGRGHVEPNPTVGCVITDRAGQVVGMGHHERFGGPHAEVAALRQASRHANGGTLYVTLEPCAHTGKTPPCVDAIIEAGITRVVFSEVDPHPAAREGARRLREAGVTVDRVLCQHAIDVSAPFVHRIETGLPWVIAKWAQTIDGRIATRTGESRWISNPASRRMVHRERGRVDAILTGIGTILADDPLLTARDVRARRIARRVIVDPNLRIPVDCAVVRTARQYSVTVFCLTAAIEQEHERVADLSAAGVEVIGLPMVDDDVPLAPMLRELVRRHETATVLVESGAGLLGRLFRKHLVNSAWVFVAPTLLGDEHAYPCVRGIHVEDLAAGTRLVLQQVTRRRDDVVLRYRVKGRA